MIRTLIVDDEYLIRYGICHAVDWISLGYEIIGEADNGQVALAQIKALRPELVLLDINLPIMDGIEVCRQIKEQHLNSEVIILTGYDDFKYIQECLRLGVLNYVVKPIETEELTDALQKAKQTINIKKNMYKQYLPMDREATSNETLQSLYEKINKIVAEHKKEVFVGLAEVDYLKRENPSTNAQSLVISCVMDAIAEFYKQENRNILCSRYDNQILLCFLEKIADIKESMTGLREYLHIQLGVSISCGLCTIPFVAGELQRRIEIAQDALALKFHMGIGQLYERKERINYNLSLEINTSKLYSYLIKAQGQEFLQYIEEILKKAIEKRISRNNYILLCAGIINTILNFSASQSILLDDSQKNQFNISTYLDYYETAGEIKDELMNACAAFVFQFIRKPQINPLVREAMAYADKNYAVHTLSSGNIAKALNVTPNYLSKIFRQELGITITEYLTQKRIAEAVKQIEYNPDISVADLAHSVGYGDSFYFSKIFHKLKGISPSGYVAIEQAKQIKA